jgi:putative flippase GtrA
MIDRKIAMYLIFGVLTTLLNIVSYHFLYNVIHINLLIATAIAWLLAVFFAFVTNRKWVFESKSNEKRILVEMFLFIFSRVGTGFFDVGFMYISVKILNVDDIFAKIISNVIVVILNYILSKYLVFSNKSVRGE